jgi:predicted CXXCH cytochrome family protein
MTADGNRSSALLLALCASLSACTEKIVYKDLPDFVDPPAGAAGFLGYSNAATKRTTCGNCHSGKQAVWQNTNHAKAWSDLEASGHMAKSCESCHSVTAKGNSSTDATAGYATTQNERYEDVQCESCHGPGLTHATNPDVKSNQPLASVTVGVDLTNGCGECHSGEHQPFVEQWSESRHGRAQGSRYTNSSCWACHEGRHALEAWGITTSFEEGTDPAKSVPVVCIVCHDPHNKKNEHQLRFSISTPSLEENLCMKCHYRRAVPEVTSSSSPHSPQGPVLLGEAGWTPPNFIYPPKSLVGSHGSDRNPKLCAGCHVNAYSVGSFNATGHSFDPIPCVDGAGVPTGAADCTDAERSFRACVGCHLTENAARTARVAATERLNRLAGEVEALLPMIPSSEFSTADNRISTGEGSKFNAQLARQPGTPIHNPFLVEALLIYSLDQIATDYGLSVRKGISQRPMLTPPPSLNVKK